MIVERHQSRKGSEESPNMIHGSRICQSEHRNCGVAFREKKMFRSKNDYTLWGSERIFFLLIGYFREEKSWTWLGKLVQTRKRPVKSNHSFSAIWMVLAGSIIVYLYFFLLQPAASILAACVFILTEGNSRWGRDTQILSGPLHIHHVHPMLVADFRLSVYIEDGSLSADYYRGITMCKLVKTQHPAWDD